MSGTSKISTRVSFRLPNQVVRTLEHRIAGKRSRWTSIGEYLKERIIYDVTRKHSRQEEPTTLQEIKQRIKEGK